MSMSSFSGIAFLYVYSSALRSVVLCRDDDVDDDGRKSESDVCIRNTQ